MLAGLITLSSSHNLLLTSICLMVQPAHLPAAQAILYKLIGDFPPKSHSRLPSQRSLGSLLQKLPRSLPFKFNRRSLLIMITLLPRSSPFNPPWRTLLSPHQNVGASGSLQRSLMFEVSCFQRFIHACSCPSFPIQRA